LFSSSEFAINCVFTTLSSGFANADQQAGARVAAAARMAVFHELGYTCSAGIAHNKLLAKIASALNKPGPLSSIIRFLMSLFLTLISAQQTLVPSLAAATLLRGMPVRKIPLLGGKLGFVTPIFSFICSYLFSFHVSSVPIPGSQLIRAVGGDPKAKDGPVVTIDHVLALSRAALQRAVGEQAPWLGVYLRGRDER
jgi:hypothetical protein